MKHSDPRGRILVVDDHPHSLKIVMRLLSEQGFETARSSNGEEAMNRILHERFDAVVSDVEMAGMSGFQLLQNIHVRRPHLTVVLMTAFYTQEAEDAALAWGSKALMEKPFDGDVLSGVLDRALREGMRFVHGAP